MNGKSMAVSSSPRPPGRSGVPVRAGGLMSARDHMPEHQERFAPPLVSDRAELSAGRGFGPFSSPDSDRKLLRPGAGALRGRCRFFWTMSADTPALLPAWTRKEEGRMKDEALGKGRGTPGASDLVAPGQTDLRRKAVGGRPWAGKSRPRLSAIVLRPADPTWSHLVAPL